MEPTRIKICGLATEGSCVAVSTGVDLIGLNFWPRSKRYVTPNRAAELEALLPKTIERVGLFVDPSSEEVRAALDACRIDVLQFHGDESPAFCRSFARPFIKAFRLRDAGVLETIQDYLDGPDDRFLVDAWVPGMVGGTGALARRDLALAAARRPGRMILAGGLTAETVGEAVREVRPWAVDTAGGVERTPGDKDPTLVRAFVAAVQEAQR